LRTAAEAAFKRPESVAMTSKAVPLFLCSILLLAVTAAAQTSGAIVGTVRDNAGVVPGAEVSLTHQETGVKRSATTNAEGHYEFPNLQSGTYSVTASMAGYRKFTTTGVLLDTNARVRQDAMLSVGQVTETVTVQAGPGHVDTETSTIGTLVTAEQIAKTSLNGRNYVKLAMLVPGASYTSGADELVGAGALGNPGAPVAINGLDNKMNSWNLDGAHNVNHGNGEGNFFMPALDSIQEVQIQTTTYTAEHGSTAGAVINVVSKSGTQEYRGSLYHYLRNDAFDARNALSFIDRTGDGKADPGQLRQNNFGYSIGGPVVLPGRSRAGARTFFFWNNEWLRRRDGAQTILAATPTQAMRAGDFSAEAIRTGQPVRDPLTGQPFPNNRMPPNRINANAALMLQQYLPLPNRGGSDFNNFQNDALRVINNLSLTARVDHHFSPSQHLWGKWARNRSEDLFPNAAQLGGTVFPTFRRDFRNDADTAGVQLDSTLSNRMFNQLNVSWLRSNNVLGVVGSGVTVSRPSALSMGRFFPDADPLDIIPNVSFSGGWGGMGTGQLPLPEAGQDHWTIRNDFSFVAGHHSLRFGGLAWRYEQNQWTFNGAQGAYNFNGRFTGHPIADFMLGMANTYTQRDANFKVNYSFVQFEAYAQDNWRATDRLSLNLGARLFRLPMINVRGNRASSFDPARFDGAKAPVVMPNGLLNAGPQTDLLNGLALAGQGVPDGFAGTTLGMAPRLGFSYDLSGAGRMVVRGGYGMGFQNYGNNFSTLAQQAPYLNNITLDNVPFDAPAQGVERPLAPQSIAGFDPDFRRPYSQNWSLGIQSELPWQFVAQVAYVGNKYNRGERWLNVNQPTSVGSLDFDPRLNAGTVNINTIRPFPGYSDITFFTYGNESNYHSLQVSFQRRFEQGFALQGQYTRQQTIGNTAGNRDARHQNNYRPELDRGLFVFDRPHSFTVNYIYELPFLRGGRGVIEAILGGWEVSGFTVFQGGQALTPGITGGQVGLATRPDRTTEPLFGEGTKTMAQWFNPAAFSRPQPGMFGNAGVGSIRGPGFQTWDVALSKAFPLSVRGRDTRFFFRVEAFNVFNHVNYSGVNTTLGAGTYGRVTSVREPRQVQFNLRFEF
jgi:Carboxypeptidase regulatory-like domain